MRLKPEQIEQGLHAAHMANLQFDNMRKLNEQLQDYDPSSSDHQEKVRSLARVAGLYKSYVAMAGIFFSPEVIGDDDNPRLSGAGLERIET